MSEEKGKEIPQIQQSKVTQTQAEQSEQSESDMPVFNGLKKRIDELCDEIGNEKLRSHLHEINQDLNLLWNCVYDNNGLIRAIGEVVPDDYVTGKDLERAVQSIQKNQDDLREEVNRTWNRLHDLVNDFIDFRSNMESSIIAKLAPVLSKLVAQRLQGTIIPTRQANAEESRAGYVLAIRLANVNEVREAAKKPQQIPQQEPLSAEARYEAARIEFYEARKIYEAQVAAAYAAAAQENS